MSCASPQSYLQAGADSGAEAVSLACVDVDMYIVLVFIGVVSLRYNNAAEWFQMAKSSTYLLKPAKNRLTPV